MSSRLRQILLALIAFAFIGGASSQLARSAESAAPMMMAGVPCEMMMSHTGMQDSETMPPCKAMTSNCLKHLGCAIDAALPVRTPRLHIAVRSDGVDYWSAWTKLTNFVHEPEPLPPRTI